MDDGCGVDVEVLRVEGEGPEEAFGGDCGGIVGEVRWVGAACAEEGGIVGLDFTGGWVFEVCRWVLLEVVLVRVFRV